MQPDLSIYINKIEIDFKSQIEEINIRSQIVKQNFLNHDLSLAEENLTRKLDPDPTFLAIIYYYYQQLCFNPDPEIKNRFKRWGIPKPLLKWMIPLNDIIQEINEIEKNKKIIFFKNVALIAIKTHLEIKIRYEVVSWASRLSKVKMDLNAHKQYKTFFRRLKEGNGKIKRVKHPGEQFLQEQINELGIAAGDSKEGKKLFLDIAKGNSKDFVLKQLLEGYFEVEKITESELYCCMFNLFKLICKEKKWLSPLEFDERLKSDLAKKRKKRYYDGDYDFYMARKLRNYLYKK